MSQYIHPKSPRSFGNGHRGGGGRVMAWRDPFVFIDKHDRIHLFLSAKAASRRGAPGHTILRRDKQRFRLEKLFPSATIPGGKDVTRVELPRIYHDAGQGTHCPISASSTA